MKTAGSLPLPVKGDLAVALVKIVSVNFDPHLGERNKVVGDDVIDVLKADLEAGEANESLR